MCDRYSNWLSSGLAARKMGNASSNSGAEWAVSAVPDDFVYVRTFYCLHILSFAIMEYFICQ